MSSEQITVGDLMRLLEVYPAGARLSFCSDRPLLFADMKMEGPHLVSFNFADAMSTDSSPLRKAVHAWIAHTHETGEPPEDAVVAGLVDNYGVSERALRDAVRLAWASGSQPGD